MSMVSVYCVYCVYCKCLMAWLAWHAPLAPLLPKKVQKSENKKKQFVCFQGLRAQGVYKMQKTCAFQGLLAQGFQKALQNVAKSDLSLNRNACLVKILVRKCKKHKKVKKKKNMCFQIKIVGFFKTVHLFFTFR